MSPDDGRDLEAPHIGAILEPHARRFYAEYPEGKRLVAAIVRSGWQMSYLGPVASDGRERGRPQDWILRARPPAEIADSFDLQVEVLFYVSPFDDLQARTVERVRAAVDRDPRASRDVAFLVTGDEAADDKIGQVPRNEGVIPLSWGWVRSAGGGGQGDKPLRSRLEKFIYARDLFDVQVPVVGSRFFGRQHTLQRLHRHSVSDQPVGIFGLRKIGKTSLLKAFVAESREWVAGEPALLPVHLDLQAIPPGRRDQTYLFWEIGRRTLEALTQFPGFQGAPPRMRLFGADEPPTASDDASLPFHSDLRKVIEQASRFAPELHVVIVLDEIERLVPPGTAEKGFEGAVELLRYFRGLNQEGMPLSVVVAGANPYLAERAAVGGQENPLLNFIMKHYLAPLEDDEARFMIQRLGGMMGVRFHHEAATAIVNHAGGHPYLTRQLASIVVRRDKRSRPITIELKQVDESLGDFAAAQHHTFEQIFASLDDYPDEQFLLRQLARGETAFVRAWVESDPVGVEHLKGYGLIEPVDDEWAFTIPLLREFLVRTLL